VKDWYEHDSTWNVWVKNREEYVEKFVHEGRFHSGVHEDVVKDFRIATHIMAGAWYHYPMYDEAIRKLLITVEMAVMLRANEVGIDVPERAHLETVIKKLFPKSRELFSDQLHRLRKIRNRYAHPKHHSFGAIALRPIIPVLINALNRIFLTDDQAAADLEYVKVMRDKLAQLTAPACVLTWREQQILVKQVALLDARQVEGKWISFWTFYPILQNPKETLTLDNCPLPIMAGLVDAVINQESFEAKELSANLPVHMEPLIHPFYLSKVEEHVQAWASLDEKEQGMINVVQRDVVWNELNEFQYQNFWK
jgi:hypothetical protein